MPGAFDSFWVHREFVLGGQPLEIDRARHIVEQMERLFWRCQIDLALAIERALREIVVPDAHPRKIKPKYGICVRQIEHRFLARKNPTKPGQ